MHAKGVHHSRRHDLKRTNDQVSEEISDSEISKVLERSGYLIESRVYSQLVGRGHFVAPNHSLPIGDEGKGRELDIFAEKSFPGAMPDGTFLTTSIIAECVNNPQPLAFILNDLTPEHDVMAWESDLVKVCGNPLRTIRTVASWEPLVQALAFQDFHHYAKGLRSTQYCTFVRKKHDGKHDWMAKHDDAHHDDFMTLSAASDYLVERTYVKDIWKSGKIDLQFLYPMLIVQGRLLTVEHRGSSTKLADVNAVQYCHMSYWNRRRVQTRIDVVRESHLPDFLRVLDTEIEAIAERIRGNLGRLLRAAEKLAREPRF